MPIQFGNRDDFLQKILDRIAPSEPIVTRETKEQAAVGYMDWRERLRSTEEMLQKLSDSYPFSWHGNQ